MPDKKYIMKNQYVKILSVLISFFLFNSCATLLFGTHQKVSINSTPSGADIYINGIAANKQTPNTVLIKRRVKPTEYNKKNQYNYLLTKEGYEDYIVSDNAKFRYGSLLDIGWDIIPFIIDIPTGAIWKYDRRNNVNLSVSNNRTSTVQTIKTRSINNKLTQNETDELLRKHFLALIAKDEANKQKEKELKRQQREENWKIIAQGVTQGLQQYDAQQQFQNNPNALTLTNYTNVVANNNTISSDAVNANDKILSSNNTGSTNSITDAYNQSAAKIAAMQADNNIVRGGYSNTNSESLAGSANTAGNNTLNSDAAACSKQAMEIYHSDDRYLQYLKNPSCSKLGYISQKAAAEISLNNCRQYLPQGEIDGLIKTIDWLNTTIKGMPDCQIICWVSPEDPFFSVINSKRDNALKALNDKLDQNDKGLDEQYFYPLGNRADGLVVCKAHKKLDCAECNHTVDQLRKTAKSNYDNASKNIYADYEKAFEIRKVEYCNGQKN